MSNEALPSNLMTNDIASLAMVSRFAAECFFMSEGDIERLRPLMVHFGFTEKQREAIVNLMRVSMEVD